MSRIGGGALVLFVLVLATRALGQSALSVASITAVGKSFDRRVGVAMGVYSVLLSVLFAAAFIAVGNSVRVNGWRTAWAQVALGLIVLAAPVTLLLIRERARSRRRPARTMLRRGDGLTLAAGAAHAGLLGLRRRHLAVRAGLVRPGPVQRGRARRTRVRSADLRQVSRRDVDDRAGRPARLRLADAALVDAAAARHRDVPLRGRRSAPLPLLTTQTAAVDLRGADRAVRRHDHGDLLRGLAARVRPARIWDAFRARRRC